MEVSVFWQNNVTDVISCVRKSLVIRDGVPPDAACIAVELEEGRDSILALVKETPGNSSVLDILANPMQADIVLNYALSQLN